MDWACRPIDLHNECRSLGRVRHGGEFPGLVIVIAIALLMLDHPCLLLDYDSHRVQGAVLVDVVQ